MSDEHLVFEGVTMQIVSLITGASTEFDGQWLVEYDPERDGISPSGRPMLAHIICTSDRSKAKVYPSPISAMEDWKRICQRDPRGGRKSRDGKPNRPLTAFTVHIERL